MDAIRDLPFPVLLDFPATLRGRRPPGLADRLFPVIDEVVSFLVLPYFYEAADAPAERGLARALRLYPRLREEMLHVARTELDEPALREVREEAVRHALGAVARRISRRECWNDLEAALEEALWVAGPFPFANGTMHGESVRELRRESLRLEFCAVAAISCLHGIVGSGSAERVEALCASARAAARRVRVRVERLLPARADLAPGGRTAEAEAPWPAMTRAPC